MTINQKTRQTVNEYLHAICKDYRNQIPLGDIFTALRRAGLVAVQEDGREWAGLLCGREGRAMIEVAPVLTATRKPDGLAFTAADNIALNLSWYKMESGRYETNAYLA